VLTATAAAADAPLPRAEILMDVARLYENQLVDAERAEAVYRQVLQLAPQDAAIALPACRALERIYAAGDSRQLSRSCGIEVKLEDDSERGASSEAAGRAVRDGARRPAGGHRSWRARLEDDPVDAQALSALDRSTSGPRAGADSWMSFARASD